MTAEPIQFAWPKPSEDLDDKTLIRLLNIWKPAGEIVLVADGGGTAIAAGGLVYLPCPNFKAIIMGWAMIGDQAAGSMVVDIWKTAYPTVPTVANTITAAAKPSLVAQQVNKATSVPTWTAVQIAENDILAFHIDTAAVNTRVTLSLSIARGDTR